MYNFIYLNIHFKLKKTYGLYTDNKSSTLIKTTKYRKTFPD